MNKTVLITGSTDGIGLETAKRMLAEGHKVLLHGRNASKLADVIAAIEASMPSAQCESYVADLSKPSEVAALAQAVKAKHRRLDVLINNAGVFKTQHPIAENGLDARFMVNTIAPYQLTQALLPILPADARVVNLSSAAQAPVDSDLLLGKTHTSDEFMAYAQSKLALTMWSNAMANNLGTSGPMIVAVNPGSLLASKMVKEGFGMAGNDIGIGVDILMRAAFADEFADAHGKYFDNDAAAFANPHPAGMDIAQNAQLLATLEAWLSAHG